MKIRNQLKKHGAKIVALVPASVLAFGMNAANAAVDISTETDAAKADIATAGALIIGVVVAIAVIAWVRRVIH